MTEIVAERVLRDLSSGAPVIARIFAPERIEESEWTCKIEVQGLAAPFETSIMGVDSFQSLYLGLRVLCALLEKHEASLTFLDGAPGDASLPLVSICPPELRAEVHRFIEGKLRDHLASRV
jgi:hypothetical protein